MSDLLQTYTSTGSKFFAHQEAMTNLRNGKGQAITAHVMCTDICNHSCAFCSVQARAGDSLLFSEITGFLDILLEYGLKAVILSGGGNPILYRCKKTQKTFNEVVDACYARGLDIGLITNGMPLREFQFHNDAADSDTIRESWGTVRPETLDKLSWIRISMSGLDHEEDEVFVPDIDKSKTTLGFSYVAHDIYNEPDDPHHGKVSRPLDIISGSKNRPANRYFEERIDELTDKIRFYVRTYKPKYVRLLPNCLEPELIPQRCKQLESMAHYINFKVDREVVFVQQKPPKAPHACYLGYVHPVLNCDGFVYPCDSCVLNEAAGHQFGQTWRICRWDEIGSIYEKPVRSLIADPAKTCPQCVFSTSNEVLRGVVNGGAANPPSTTPEHVNFV